MTIKTNVSAFLILATVSAGTSAPVVAQPAERLYWCPEKSRDQRYGVAPEPGCLPLVEAQQEEKQTADRTPKARLPIKVEQLQSEISSYLRRYGRFLKCCAADPDALEQVEELEDEASDLLRAAQRGFFSEQKKLRGFMLAEVIPPVAQARDALRKLKQRLEQIRESQEALELLDYEAVARERRRLRELEESIIAEFRPRKPLAAPPTGTEIGVTPAMGPEIGAVPPTGPAIGVAPPTGMDIGVTPPTGREIGQTPPTGFEVGTTGRAGPEIGESTLNRPRE